MPTKQKIYVGLWLAKDGTPLCEECAQEGAATPVGAYYEQENMPVCESCKNFIVYLEEDE